MRQVESAGEPAGVATRIDAGSYRLANGIRHGSTWVSGTVLTLHCNAICWHRDQIGKESSLTCTVYGDSPYSCTPGHMVEGTKKFSAWAGPAAKEAQARTSILHL
jgi:hypothetical protein